MPDCPVPGCPRQRSEQHMMCRACWGRVSTSTQRAVYAAWRGYGKARRGGDVLSPAVQAAARAYREIRAAAINEADA